MPNNYRFIRFGYEKLFDNRQSNAQRWQEATVPLDLSSGDMVRIAFATEALNKHQWTWAVWGEPELSGIIEAE